MIRALRHLPARALPSRLAVTYYTANPTNIAPVGTATSGAGLWGQLDLAGNYGSGPWIGIRNTRRARTAPISGCPSGRSPGPFG